MRGAAGVGAALALLGCVGGGTAGPQPAADPACAEAARLAAAAEHKPAVDALAAAADGGAGCEPAARAAVAASQQTLARADDLVRRGLEEKRAGDRAAAERSLRQALQLYPKYYWAQKLLGDLRQQASAEEPALRLKAAGLLASARPGEALAALEEAARLTPEESPEIRRLRDEIAELGLAQAQRAQHDGDLAGAGELAVTAAAAAPGPPVRERVVDFARRLGLDLFSAGELVRAQSVWRAALTLDAGDALLRQYLDEVGERLESLDEIRKGGG